jgi:carbohydrate binding protein with CBM4/9 domain/tetratricopeptide repeat protein
MRLKLNSAFRKSAVAIAALILGTCTVVFATRSVVAWSAAQNGDWSRAARLEPENADWPCNLGASYTILQNDPRAAIPHLEIGVRLNPHDAVCWTALGDSYAQAGDLANERRTLEAALRADPNDAHIALNTATIYANSDEVERALPLYRVAIQKRPDWAAQLLPNIWLHDPNAEELMAKALPPTASPRLALLKLLVGKNESGPAALVWQTIIQSKEPVESKGTLFFIDSLLAQNNVDAATQAWQQLTARDADLAQRSARGNLISNAGFEHSILNGGFDWIYKPVEGIDVSVDTAEFHSGNRSLAVNFDTDNLGTTGLKQLVRVQPGSHYSFSAWIRADSIETASGPRFAFSDTRTRQILFDSEDALGSFPWRSVSGEFNTGPGTNLLELSIVRNPANGRIRGKIWIDDLELVRNP